MAKKAKKQTKKRAAKSKRVVELEAEVGDLQAQRLEAMQLTLDLTQENAEANRRVDGIYEVLFKTQGENIILVASLNERKKAFDDLVSRQFKASNIRANNDPLYRLVRDAWRENNGKVPLGLFASIADEDVPRANQIVDELMLGKRITEHRRGVDEEARCTGQRGCPCGRFHQEVTPK